jgi:hypothetical protein
VDNVSQNTVAEKANGVTEQNQWMNPLALKIPTNPTIIQNIFSVI